MKVKIVCVLAVVGMAMAMPAYGLSWGGYEGPVLIHLQNYDTGAIYNAGTQVVTGEANLNALLQTPPPQGVTGGAHAEDSWGIFRIDQILKDDGTGDIIYSRSSSVPELTGIFWGGYDTYLDSQNGGLTQFIHARGINVAVFEDAANNFSFAGGTGARSNSTNDTATNQPTYNTVTDGNLLWTFSSVPGHDTTPAFSSDEFFTKFNPAGPGSQVSADGGFFAKLATVPGWGAGPGNSMWAVNPSGNVNFPHDVTLKFTGDGNGISNTDWILHSSDPLKGVAVPLPSSVYMGFAGLAALAFGAYRRQRAA